MALCRHGPSKMSGNSPIRLSKSRFRCGTPGGSIRRAIWDFFDNTGRRKKVIVVARGWRCPWPLTLLHWYSSWWCPWSIPEWWSGCQLPCRVSRLVVRLCQGNAAHIRTPGWRPDPRRRREGRELLLRMLGWASWSCKEVRLVVKLAELVTAPMLGCWLSPKMFS